MAEDIVELRRRVISDLNDSDYEFGGYVLGRTSSLYRAVSEFSNGLEKNEGFKLLSSALIFYNPEKFDILKTEFNYSQRNIDDIRAITESAVYTQSPSNGTERLFCDAVASELSREDYFMYNGIKRKMLSNEEIVFSNVQWFSLLRDLFLYHEYFTRFGKTRFEEGKKINLAKILTKLRQEELKS